MKSVGRLSALCCVILVVLQFSCAAPKALEYRDFKNFSIEKVGFSNTTVKMELVYFNPNNFGLQLKTTSLDVYINNTFLGHTGQDYQITIPKKTDFTMPFKMDIDMKNLLKNSFNALTKNQVQVKVTGTITVGKANVFISFPVRYEGAQSFSVF